MIIRLVDRLAVEFAVPVQVGQVARLIHMIRRVELPANRSFEDGPLMK